MNDAELRGMVELTAGLMAVFAFTYAGIKWLCEQCTDRRLARRGRLNIACTMTLMICIFVHRDLPKFVKVDDHVQDGSDEKQSGDDAPPKDTQAAVEPVAKRIVAHK